MRYETRYIYAGGRSAGVTSRFVFSTWFDPVGGTATGFPVEQYTPPVHIWLQLKAKNGLGAFVSDQIYQAWSLGLYGGYAVAYLPSSSAVITGPHIYIYPMVAAANQAIALASGGGADNFAPSNFMVRAVAMWET